MEQVIRVLISDDHPIVRKGLQALIGSERDMQVVAETSSAHEAVSLARELNPDVILLDLVYPNDNGLDALGQILADNPNARVLILSSYADSDRLFPAVRVGAFGYILKDANTDQLLQAIRDIGRGESYFHPTVALRMIRELDALGGRGNGGGRSTPSEPLTERELDVLRLVATGKTNLEISIALEISERTVGNHIGSILHKLRLNNRTQATLYALRQGLVDLDGHTPGHPES